MVAVAVGVAVVVVVVVVVVVGVAVGVAVVVGVVVAVAVAVVVGVAVRMTSSAITAAAALRVVARAKRAGMGPGAIADALGVTSRTIDWWELRPDTVPHARVRAKVAELAAKLKESKK